MQHESPSSGLPEASPLDSSSTMELMRSLMDQTKLLVKKEIELAKAEVLESQRQEITAAVGLGFAGVCGLAALSAILMAIVLALATIMSGWLAALIVAAFFLVLGGVAGLMGWNKRVKQPLAKTRKTLKEDARWAKERTA